MKLSDYFARMLMLDIQCAIEEVMLLEPGTAAVISEAIFKRLRKNWGGKEVYIPASINDKHAEIKSSFNGCNHAEVCRDFKISLRQLYRIICTRHRHK